MRLVGYILHLKLEKFFHQILSSKALLKLMGVPFMTAPSEAEAQCAALNLKGLADVVVTTDTDALAFGAKKVFINLSESIRGDSVEELDLEKCLHGRPGLTSGRPHLCSFIGYS